MASTDSGGPQGPDLIPGKANSLIIFPRNFYKPGKYLNFTEEIMPSFDWLMSNVFGRKGHPRFSYFLTLH